MSTNKGANERIRGRESEGRKKKYAVELLPKIFVLAKDEAKDGAKGGREESDR